MKTTPPPTALWRLAALVIAAQLAGIIIAFSVVDPCACRRDLDEIQSRIDAQSAELRALYEDVADSAR